ncbi:hypothetical protein JYT16_01670 [Gemmatimonas aurantiaca]|nr:hypothetical protein [Gemmatimonas aurantiaca]
MADEKFKRPTDVSTTNSAEEIPEVEMDPRKYEMYLQKIREEQNLVNGIMGGAIAALVGGGVWAGVTVLSGWQIGWMAIGIGFIVGYAIRTFGKGMDMSFGVSGAALSLVGCLAGNLFTIVYYIGEESGMPIGEVFSILDMNTTIEMMLETFAPMDLLFYGLALYYGYKYSFRVITHEEMVKLRK